MNPAYSDIRFRGGPAPIEWPNQFAIISAHATTGERWSRERNEAADAALRARIESLGFWHERIVGYSPETGHQEPSWAADVSLRSALELGSEFLQDAIFWVEGGALSVHNCAANGTVAHLGSFHERLDAIGPEPAQRPASGLKS